MSLHGEPEKNGAMQLRPSENIIEILNNGTDFPGVPAASVDFVFSFGVFVHRLCGGIASMAASAGGVDALVFTAGIGEHSAEVRAAACGRLDWLGVAIDERANRGEGDREIASGAVRVLVVKTQEEKEIARDVSALLWHS